MPSMNLDRMRELLLSAEKKDATDEVLEGYVDVEDSLVNGDSYQLLLMRDAGWIESNAPEFGSFRMTYIGHEYLNAVRNESVWKSTKEVIANEGGSMALELVKALAMGFAKKQVEKHTGMKL